VFFKARKIASGQRLPPALKHREYRLFWTGAVLSAVGSQFTTVAMAWQIYQLTNSPFQVGLLGLGRAVPQITLSLFGGLLADAVDRRRLMMGIQLGQCAVSSTLAGLTLTGNTSPPVLFAAAVLFAFGSALETPSRQAIVPNLVPRSDLTSAIALNNAQRSAATILGPSIAGVLLAISGPAWCYVLDAASWFAMVGALALIRKPLQIATGGKVSVEALGAGVRFVLTHQVILAFMVLDFGATLFGSSNALFPVYARDLLKVGPVGLGIMYAAPSVGALATATAMSSTSRIHRAGMWVLVGVALYGTCIIAFAISHIFWLSAFMLAGTGVGNMVSSILRGTSNQLLTPDDLRGRVAAVNSIFVIGGLSSVSSSRASWPHCGAPRCLPSAEASEHFCLRVRLLSFRRSGSST